MVKKIFVYVIFAVVILLIGMWVWAGGWARISGFVRTIPNPIDIFLGNTSDSYVVQLPWQVPVPQGPDLSGYADMEITLSPEEQLENAEEEYARLKQSAENLRTFGEPSPYRGRVLLSAAAAVESDPAAEHLEIHASYATGPITISGWSLQSMLTGARVLIPQGAPQFQQGAVNRVEPIVLESGVRAILTSGPSPVGVSFRETICTGYLAQFQKFNPQLSNSCLSPREAAPITAGNLQQYGDACVDYVAQLPRCYFPASVPSDLSLSCRLFIANTFSYNGCVATFKSDRNFSLDTWRLYAGSQKELWRNTHDVIRLVDAEGRTVDSITY